MKGKIEDIHSIKRREIEESIHNVEIIYNKIRIPIPLKFIQYVDALESRVDYLESEIIQLRSAISKIESPEVSDQVAEDLITDFILKKRKDGIKELDILDIVDSLKLPYNQIIKVMEKLKKRGIRDIEHE